jgi:hypothetical protein
MSNLFEIATQASTAAPLIQDPPVAVPANKPGPKPKPLAERRSLHALQLTRRDTSSPISATIDGLLAQFKANNNDEFDSDSLANGDQRRRSYTREQKLTAIGYATIKKVWDPKIEQKVLISHKQACRDLALELVQLRR